MHTVDSLQLEKDCAWSPHTLLHLKTLNPRHLVIGTASIHKSVATLLSDALKGPELTSLAQNFIPPGLPNFELLTTRLETLDICCHCYSIPSIPTLVKFTGPSGFQHHSLLGPPTLTSLTLTSDESLEELFTQFPILTYLKLLGDIDMLSPSFVLPTTLTHFDLDSGEDDMAPPSIFSNPSLKHVPLATLALRMPYHPEGPFDLGLLPNTLTSLTLSVSTYYYYGEYDEGIPGGDWETDSPHHDLVTSFPTDLVHFSINLDLLQRLQFTDFATWTSLEHLEITEEHDGNYPTKLSALPISAFLTRPAPPKLKSFLIRTGYIDISEEDIQLLPPTLTRLELAYLDFTLIGALETYLSQAVDCRASIDDPAILFKILRKHWFPHMDVMALKDAADDYLNVSRIKLKHPFPNASWQPLPVPPPKDSYRRELYTLGITANFAENLDQLCSVVLPPSATAILDYMPTNLTSLTSLRRPLHLLKVAILDLDTSHCTYNMHT